MKCPTCGQPIKNHNLESTQRLKSVAAIPLSAPVAPIREIPTGLPGWDTHVKIPLRQALISGLLDAPVWFAVGGGLTGAFLICLDAMPVDVSFTGWGLLVISASGGAIGGLIAFCRTAKREWPERLGIYDALLWQAEEATGFDLDGDGEIGQPDSNQVVIEVRKDGRPWKFESLEISQDRLIKLARAIAGGQTFSERSASSCNIPREEFNALRDKFVSRGWAEWKGKPGSTQGVKLTDEGLDIVGEMATTPLPRASQRGENMVLGTHARNSTHQNGNGRY